MNSNKLRESLNPKCSKRDSKGDVVKQYNWKTANVKKDKNKNEAKLVLSSAKPLY